MLTILVDGQILTNLLLLLGFIAFFGLQRTFYGRLRPIEIEQLYERGWFAITETSLAMTMFRDEIGGWFLVMFVSLLAGKVWNWIGEGRVEFLEQQPPANPRLFYSRLFISLSVSVLYDLMMMNYCLDTVLDEAKPGMMVMFAFEFGVLMISSLSTFLRNVLVLNELYVVEQQTKAKLEARRAEVRAAREQAERNAGSGEAVSENLPREEDIDENDIDVPGWEEKGRWMFYLDLATGEFKEPCQRLSNLLRGHLSDFFKLMIYIAFFAILTSFHGLPIHIMRDVFLTARSFGKRIYDFLRYRKATHDMNDRYPDATAEELENESTCIICREDMRPWVESNTQSTQPELTSHERMDQRLRAKKLPCGHVLHFGCLRSWLERQQVCPTCRRSVLSPNSSVNGRNGQQNQPNGPNQTGGQQNANQDAQNGNRSWLRNINLGPLRITFGATRITQQQLLEQLRAGRFNPQQPLPQPPSNPSTNPSASPGAIGSSLVLQLGLLEIERQILAEMRNLRNTHDQLEVIRRMQGELDRLRELQNHPLHTNSSLPTQFTPFNSNGQPHGPIVTSSVHNTFNTAPPASFHPPRAFSVPTEDAAMGPEHPNLPSGMTIPQGWSVLPLEPLNPDSTSHPTPHPSGSMRPSFGQNTTNSSEPASFAFPISDTPNAHFSSSPSDPNAGTSSLLSSSSQAHNTRNHISSSQVPQVPQSLTTNTISYPPTTRSVYNRFPSRSPISDAATTSSASLFQPNAPVNRARDDADWDFSRLSNHTSPSDGIKSTVGNVDESQSMSDMAQTTDGDSNAASMTGVTMKKDTKGKGRAVEMEDGGMD